MIEIEINKKHRNKTQNLVKLLANYKRICYNKVNQNGQYHEVQKPL